MIERRNVALIGSGAREHAIGLKLLASRKVNSIYSIPGNCGLKLSGGERVIPVNIAVSDVDAIVDWCNKNKPHLVIVGPEEPLSKGIADKLTKLGVRCFGPTKRAALIECDKAFSKDSMLRYNIPTAEYKSFTDCGQASKFIRQKADIWVGFVVKASGLAGGKGVLITRDAEEACKMCDSILNQNLFGDAGKTIVVEELIEGEECSALAFCDGTNVSLMPICQDHKRAFDGDSGPNTGGMGAICPMDRVESNPKLKKMIHDTVISRCIKGLKWEGAPYVGVLYAGLMITDQDRVRVLEFNCRFGDPEVQSMLPLLKSDLYEVMEACVEGRLHQFKVRWAKGVHTCGIVLADADYPESVTKGQPISNVDLGTSFNIYCEQFGVSFIHGGTKLNEQGKLVTDGGRILTVVGSSSNLRAARDLAMSAVKRIEVPKCRYRTDIGQRAIDRALRFGLTYKSCGVDIERGDEFVEHVKEVASITHRDGVLSQIGSFGAFFDVSMTGLKDPILVSGTDGVGTKLKLAIDHDRVDHVGVDLVAMCVNDVLVHGAEPLFFLDYYACCKLELKTAKRIADSIIRGCRDAKCALIGGETAEMPGLYRRSDVDLAGFVVGAVERSKMLPRLAELEAGDLLIGLASSGVHSNGFSLIHRILDDKFRHIDINSPKTCPFDCDYAPSKSLTEGLLCPTKIYVRQLSEAIKGGIIKSMAHITGGGIIGNLPRCLPDNLSAQLDASKWDVPPVFAWIQKEADVKLEEMLRVFNCGLGMICVVSPRDLQTAIRLLTKKSEFNEPANVYVVGQLVERGSTRSPRCTVDNLESALEIAKTKLKYRDYRRARLSSSFSSSSDSSSSPHRRQYDQNVYYDDPSSTSFGGYHGNPHQNSGDHHGKCGRQRLSCEYEVETPKRVAILLSGTGTNAKAIIDHSEKLGAKKCGYEVVLVISNVAGAAGLKLADEAKVRTCVVTHGDFKDRVSFDMELDKQLRENRIDLVCLAGFMRILSEKFVNLWAGRLINIHPSLLPSFKGLDAYKQALESGVRVTGCTVHFVNSGVDEGAIILQETIQVCPNDSVESLSERGKLVEHQAFPKALSMLSKDLNCFSKLAQIRTE